MPATTASTGTDKFVDFEERRYQLRVVKCEESVSPPPDNRPQFKWEFALEGSRDPESGGELIRRVWTSQIWNETSGKESHLVLLARALCGPAITEHEFNRLSFEDLVGLRGSALVSIDAKGWPAIDKTTFRAIANRPAAAPVAAPSMPATAIPGATANPKQVQLMHMAAEANDIPPDSLALHIAERFGGKTDKDLTGAEVVAVTTSIQNGEIAPF
jgi:hypothetical protein